MVAEADAVHPESSNAFRSLQFYLRMVFGVLLLLAMAFGWWVMQRQKALVQSEAVEQVRRLGADVYLDYQWSGRRPVVNPVPLQPPWMRRLFGAEIFDRAVALDMQRVDDLTEVTRWMKRLPYLRFVNASGTSLSDEQLKVFSGLGNLEYLNLSGTSVSDSGLVQLAGLVQLEYLSLAGSSVTQGGLRHLERLRRLRILDLSGSQVGKEVADRFGRRLPNCRVLCE